MSTGTSWVYLSHDRFSHHGTHSGYVQLLKWVDPRKVIVTHLPLRPRGMRYLSERRAVRAELRSSQMKGELHIYPEQTLAGGRVEAPKVAVVHQPPSRLGSGRLKSKLLRRDLTKTRLVIGLGTAQVAWISKNLNRAVVVPHGIDVEWFSPRSSEPEDHILAVHGWLRGAALEGYFEECRANGLRVLQAGGHNKRLSDLEYLDLLNSSRAVLVSIPNGVASNAILEAAACGKPVIGDLSPDTREYLSEENRELLLRPLREQIRVLESEGSAIGRANRQRVLSFSWDKIAHRLASILADA